ncbi:MAG TPA: hypothetical protein VGM79_26325 [Streptosporangiaceae bacterium]|jgi:hypothetical protein
MSEAILGTANELRRLVERVTPEEFSWQEANYGRDSELGCELLYLIANNEWARATSEIIDISQRRAVDTTIRIDVDLDRITHEAFRYRSGRLWLPVFVLPPPLKEQGQPWPEPDPFGTMTVTDDSGTPLPTMAGAEVRHRISAALAEIIVNIASTRLPRAAVAGFAATRDHRLVLSAAIYRLLRSGASLPPEEPDSRRGEPETVPGASRLSTARHGLGVLLSWYAQLLERAAAPGHGGGPAGAGEPAELAAGGGGVDGTASAVLLTQRAVMVLQALAKSAVVVVAVRRNRTPAVLTLKLPSRGMAGERPPRWRLRDPQTGAWSRPGNWTWLHWRTWNWLLPRARIDVDLLLPSADADRQVRVDLPAGVSFDPSRPPAELEVTVSPPPPFGHLRQLMGQLLDEQAADRPPALHRSIADLATAMAGAAIESMREHRVASAPAPAGPGAAGHEAADPDETVALHRKLVMLRRELGLLAGPVAYAEARTALAEAWADGEWLDQPLLRCSSCDQLGLGTVVTKTSMIEDRSRRGAPVKATIHVNVAVTDAEYFSIARFSSRMSSLLMAVVLGFFLATSLLGWKNSQVSADVLAFVLTLFSAVQAGRIERSDRSTLHGLLSGAGSLLIVATVLPSVLLAVALAFSVSGVWPVGWAAGAIALQLAIAQLLQIRRGWEHGLQVSPAAATSGLSLHSEAPNYAPGEVLHSGWWRGATASALLIGRPAFGYMIWQRDSSASLRDLLSGARPAVDPGELAAAPPPPGGSAAVLPVAVRARNLLRLGQRLPVTGIMLEADAPDGDQPAVLELSHSGDLREAVPEDASVLALQRSGTARQSVTFVVFREEPKADWVSKSEATAVKLEPDRLAPIEDGIASVEIFAGLPRDRCLRPVAEHPVSVILDAAASGRLVVLDAQLPVPPPAAGYPGLLWARIRVALHDNEIGQLGPFLDAIGRVTTGAPGTDQPPEDGLVVAVRTVPDGPLRILNPRPGARPARPGLVLASDMDIMTAGPRGAGGPDEKAWRVIAMCADARAGVERGITRTLAGGLRLAGLTYAHLYGKAVCVLVAYEGTPGPAGPAAGLGAGRPGAGVTVCLNQLQSETDLGLARPEPVLRVQVRLPDRAGMTLAVLDSLRDMLPDLVADGSRPVQWQVWYARSQVSEGSTGVITLLARLAVEPHLVAGWDQAVFEDLARQVRRRAMSTAPGGLRQTDSGFRAPEETELSVRLIAMPRHDD